MKETIGQNGAGAARAGKFLTVKEMVLIAVMAALICIAAPFSVPIGLVPISLATFAVYLAGGLLGWKKGTLAVLIYVLLGAVGLPVFSGGAGGFAKLFGVTGGYIVGYIPCVLIGGLFVDLFYKRSKETRNPVLNGAWSIPAGMILGTVVLYAFGTVWFVIARGVTLETALASCVIPFLTGDAIKIVCATILTVILRDRLGRLMADN